MTCPQPGGAILAPEQGGTMTMTWIFVRAMLAARGLFELFERRKQTGPLDAA